MSARMLVLLAKAPMPMNVAARTSLNAIVPLDDRAPEDGPTESTSTMP